ncbi:Trypsin [Pedococcus cremeus]|uniref:Trypsin n=1 Tax=Pedococcus cremeus TaxID=587636 RepID=A0A1H9S476_9MICO|nr:trypsin-like serine protease [Pedococcus cremeus]SER79163.1 Trypsin [Pedococcus cremeus]
MRLARSAAVAAATTTLVAGTALAATAITGGEVDSANTYKNVGMIAFYEDGGRYRCTATLVTPTVLLTAAHCTADVKGKVAVTFQWKVADAPPSGLPVAADPNAGYTGTESTAYAFGTPHAHPQYSNFTDLKNWNDVGVVVLDQPVTGITPAKLAPKNYLNQYTPDILNKELFRIVGYGTEVRQDAAANGNMKPTPMSYPIVRRYADSPGQKLTPQILQTNGNEHDNRGTGGSCFGDSGGPTFKNGYQVTVTSYGYTSNCRYLDGLQRVDIPVVQDWLATYGVTPAAG